MRINWIFKNYCRRLSCALLFAIFALGSYLNVAVAADIELVLEGSQQVPPNLSGASGTGKIVVSADRGFSGIVTVTGINGTVGHIHEGAKGVNGPIIIPLTKSGDTYTVPTGIVLTDSYHVSLLLGNLYVNIHSLTFPGGEIRAQIVIPLFH